MEGSTPEINSLTVADADAFIHDQSDSGPPKIDSKVSLMAASKLKVAWPMHKGGQVRRI